MTVRILTGDCRSLLGEMPNESVHCAVTSPPYYGLRDYGVDGQIGLENTPDTYVEELVNTFRQLRRVLRDDGTLWLNLGDSYNNFRSQMGPGQAVHGRDKMNGKPAEKSRRRGSAGLKEKDLIGIPWLVAFALRADGWYLRSDIIWAKPNPMPESVTDRPTSSHEHVFLLSKSARYFYDAEAVRESAQRPKWAYETATTPGNKDRKDGGCTQRKTDKQRGHSRRHAGFNDRWDMMTKEEQGAVGRNLRNVWTIATQPYAEAHFATFPPKLIEPCIKAGCPKGGTVLDPFGGAGTTGLVADRLGRDAILIELNPEYAGMARARIHKDAGMFAEISGGEGTVATREGKKQDMLGKATYTGFNARWKEKHA